MSDPALIQSEDSLTAICADGINLQAMAAAFRRSGIWEEVVQGMADLTVKYDPLAMSGAEAEERFWSLWAAPLEANTVSIEPAELASIFADTPDRDAVAAALGIDARDVPGWLCQRQYRVTMMGFQPGFAYLEDVDGAALPTLPRLTAPRQHVAAGSIGFLGKRACIYALDGPGGWPIVGQVSEALFRRDHPQPFLLQTGQIVRFRAL
jgi:KipI family sensor histidine kinase inhibitor